MGCCNNKEGCQHKTTVGGYVVTDAPIESFMDVRDIAGLLLGMANTGIKNFTFKDTALDQLADTVAKLAAENNYLKKLAALLSSTSITRTEDVVTVTFGPGNAYTLLLPIGSEEARAALAAQFRTAAKNLSSNSNKSQMNLFDL